MRIKNISIGKIVGIIISVLSIVASLGSFVSYLWHSTWFKTIGLSFDFSWIRSEFTGISLLSLLYILFFLFIDLIGFSFFYLSLRSVLKGMQFLWLYEKFTDKRGWVLSTVYLLLILFISLTFIKNLLFIIPITIIIVFIPSIYFYPYLDHFSKKFRRYAEGPIYSKKDILAFPCWVIIIVVLHYIANINILRNPFTYLFILFIFFFSLILSPPRPKSSLSSFWFGIVSILFVLIFPILMLMNEAEQDAKAVIDNIQNKSYNPNIHKSQLALYGLISSELLKRGTVFIENIESVYGATYISKEECEQKALKDKWFISFGEITLVFTSKNNQTNILILKDGKFLRSVQVKGD